MPAISLELSDEQVARLEELAQRARMTPAELLQRSVEEWLTRSDKAFADAAAYVLQKNAELYRRLA